MSIFEIINILKNGGVVMHPTETCYGLAADIFNRDAVSKLYEVKGMPLDKPVSILVSSLEMARRYGDFSNKALKLAEKYWPGPLSIVVPRTLALPSYLNSGNDFVSIRYSSLDFCNELIEALGNPITTTSANRFGQPESYDSDGEIALSVDFVLEAGEIMKNKPSTIVKVEDSKVEILRQGDLYLSEV